MRQFKIRAAVRLKFLSWLKKLILVNLTINRKVKIRQYVSIINEIAVEAYTPPPVSAVLWWRHMFKLKTWSNYYESDP